MNEEGRSVRGALRKFRAYARRLDGQSWEDWEAAQSRRQVEASTEAYDAYLDPANVSSETGKRIEAYPEEMLALLVLPYKEKLTGHMPPLWARLKARAPRETGAEEADCQRSAVRFIRAYEEPQPLRRALKVALARAYKRLDGKGGEPPATAESSVSQRPSGRQMAIACADDVVTAFTRLAEKPDQARPDPGKLGAILAALQERSGRQLVQVCYAPEGVTQLDRSTIARWVRKHAIDADPVQFQRELELAGRAHLILIGMLADARHYRAIQRNRARPRGALRMVKNLSHTE